MANIEINEIPGMKEQKTYSQLRSKNDNTTLWYYGQKLANVILSQNKETVTLRFNHCVDKIPTNELKNYDFKPKVHEVALENKLNIIKYRLEQIELDFV